ncbi:hypothetical protein V8E36_009965 [Tilletia maclaganii]
MPSVVILSQGQRIELITCGISSLLVVDSEEEKKKLCRRYSGPAVFTSTISHTLCIICFGGHQDDLPNKHGSTSLGTVTASSSVSTKAVTVTQPGRNTTVTVSTIRTVSAPGQNTTVTVTASGTVQTVTAPPSTLPASTVTVNRTISVSPVTSTVTAAPVTSVQTVTASPVTSTSTITQTQTVTSPRPALCLSRGRRLVSPPRQYRRL